MTANSRLLVLASFSLCIVLGSSANAAPGSGIDTQGAKSLPLSVLGVEGCELDANGASAPNMDCYGNVGIGPFNTGNPPPYPLEVYTSNSVPAQFISTSPNRAEVQILNGGGTYSGALDLGDSASHIWEIGSDLDMNKTQTFYIYDGVAKAVRFEIDASGDVSLNGNTTITGTATISGNTTISGTLGVETTTPQATLDVNGEIRIGDTGVGCGAGNIGAMRYNASSGKFEGCNGAVWASIGGGAPTQAESVNADSNNWNQTVTNWTASAHSLCILAMYYRVHDSGNGYMSQCTIGGSPGEKWSITAHSIAEEQSCTIQCYDF